MPKHLITVLSLFAAIILLLIMNFTTPTGIGPLGVLAFFTACYVLVLGVSTIVVKIFMKISGKQMGRKGYLYAAIIAFGPIMLAGDAWTINDCACGGRDFHSVFLGE